MPKIVPAGQRREATLLLRLTARQKDWLEAAAYLERQTANEYAYQLVANHLDALKNNATVTQAVALRVEHDAAGTSATPLHRVRADLAWSDEVPPRTDGGA